MMCLVFCKLVVFILEALYAPDNSDMLRASLGVMILNVFFAGIILVILNLLSEFYVLIHVIYVV